MAPVDPWKDMPGAARWVPAVEVVAWKRSFSRNTGVHCQDIRLLHSPLRVRVKLLSQQAWRTTSKLLSSNTTLLLPNNYAAQ